MSDLQKKKQRNALGEKLEKSGERGAQEKHRSSRADFTCSNGKKLDLV